MGIGHWSTSDFEAQNGLARQLVMAVRSSKTPGKPEQDPDILAVLAGIRDLDDGPSFMRMMAMQARDYQHLAAERMWAEDYVPIGLTELEASFRSEPGGNPILTDRMFRVLELLDSPRDAEEELQDVLGVLVDVFGEHAFLSYANLTLAVTQAASGGSDQASVDDLLQLWALRSEELIRSLHVDDAE